jgi:fluoride exporter
MSAAVWIGVAVLGSAGALGRFLLDGWISARVASGLPVGTLAVNVSGTLLLGFLTGIALTGNAMVLIGSAAIGSYTTFSTWMLETHRLSEDGRGRDAAVNVIASIVIGLGAAALGRAIGGWL